MSLTTRMYGTRVVSYEIHLIVVRCFKIHLKMSPS